MTCPRCAQELGDAPLAAAVAACMFCTLPILSVGWAPPPATQPDAVVAALGGASTCFFHPDNAAVSACSDCGRYLCALCRVELEGRIRCPACFDRLYAESALPSLRKSDTLYDSIALAVGWAWILIYPFWLLAAPTVLGLAIFKGLAPNRYYIPRRPWRYALAFVGLIAPLALFLIPFRALR